MQESSSLVPANGDPALLRHVWRTRSPAAAAHHGAGGADDGLGRGLLRTARRAGYFVIRFDNRDIGLSTGSPQRHTRPDGSARPGAHGQRSLLDMPCATWRPTAPFARRTRNSARARGRRSTGGAIGQEMAIHQGGAFCHPPRSCLQPATRAFPGHARGDGRLLSPPPTDRDSYLPATSAPGRSCAAPAFRLDEARTWSAPRVPG